METWQGKHFSITDPQGVNTVIYQIYKEEGRIGKNDPKFTIERLDSTKELRGENTKKTFYVNNLSEASNQLVILSFGQDKVVINSAVLAEDHIKISKKPMPYKFETLYSEEETELKNFRYTPNLKRPIVIIDPETAEEIKPVVYLDEETNEVKGKCKLKPNKPYFAFEIREEKGKYELLGGNPSIKPV